MNWSIDAEWYDANKYQPPVDEEVLCAVKLNGFGWDKETQNFGRKSHVLMYLGSHGPRGWYIDGLYNKQPANVSYWTWLPKVPNVWVNKDE